MNKVEDDGEEDGVTREAQQQKCEHPMSNTDTTTNGSICSCKSTIRDNDDNKNNNNDNKDGEE